MHSYTESQQQTEEESSKIAKMRTMSQESSSEWEHIKGEHTSEGQIKGSSKESTSSGTSTGTSSSGEHHEERKQAVGGTKSAEEQRSITGGSSEKNGPSTGEKE
jgi:hypothetical protein